MRQRVVSRSCLETTVLLNFRKVLPPDWKFQIYHSPDNAEWIKTVYLLPFHMFNQPPIACAVDIYI